MIFRYSYLSTSHNCNGSFMEVIAGNLILSERFRIFTYKKFSHRS